MDFYLQTILKSIMLRKICLSVCQFSQLFTFSTFSSFTYVPISVHGTNCNSETDPFNTAYNSFWSLKAVFLFIAAVWKLDRSSHVLGRCPKLITIVVGKYSALLANAPICISASAPCSSLLLPLFLALGPSDKSNDEGFSLFCCTVSEPELIGSLVSLQ